MTGEANIPGWPPFHLLDAPLPARLPVSILARLLWAACLLAALPCFALERATLHLNGKHSFRFAGYYAAKELGYYAEEGLAVEFLEAAPGEDTVDAVVSGPGRYGVGLSNLLLARGKGKPVVALAVILQHSPVVILGKRLDRSRGLKDLVGKRVMMDPGLDEVTEFLRKEGVTPGDFRLVEHTHDPQDLIDDKVDAMTALLTDAPFYLELADFQYRIYSPRTSGVDFYGDNLFTSEQEIKRKPKNVAAFREASLRGWQYAMENPEKVIDIILRKYGAGQPREFYLHEAARMVSLIRQELVEIGQMHPGRWRNVAEAYVEQGKLTQDQASLDGFLYRPESRADLQRIYAILAAALAFVSIAGGIVFYVQRINSRLRRALETSRQAHASQRDSEERLRLLADHASDVIWTRDLDGRFTYVSPAVVKLRGVSVEDAMAQSLQEAFAPDSAIAMREGLDRIVAQARAGEPEPEIRIELEQRCIDGSTVWVETTATVMRDADGRIAGVVGVTRDIAERKETEARIRELALHDPLTGLPNRTLFSDRLRQAIVVAQREARRTAVMFIDLDKFKPVNDNFGHSMGDLLLKEVANRMRACVREADTVARVGGDEFVVLLHTVESGSFAVGVAEKIRHSIDQPFELEGKRLDISCSIGVALYPDHGKDEVELAKNADDAMYWSKEHGRDKVYLYRPAQEPTP